MFVSELAAPLIAHSTKDAKGDPTKFGSLERSYMPSERIGSEEDMAGTVLYMASRAGGFMNGNIVVIDGGRLSLLPATY